MEIEPFHAYFDHMRAKHGETAESITGLVLNASADHPTWPLDKLMELVHNRQHTSEDWDAGHPEEELSS